MSRLIGLYCYECKQTFIDQDSQSTICADCAPDPYAAIRQQLLTADFQTAKAIIHAFNESRPDDQESQQ
jgi:hypothetical protein